MNFLEVKGLMKRVYNSKTSLNANDEGDIKKLVEKVFGDGTVTPDPSMLHQFNNVVVQVADEIAKPKATEILGILADFKTATPGTIYQYKIPAKSKARFKWSALGTGVDLVRVEGGKSTVAVPTALQSGFSYEPLSLVQDAVENFRLLVNNAVEAKLKLYFQAVARVMQSAIASGKIPANNVKEGSNLSFADYSRVASIISRVGMGGRPIFIADSLMIDYFANFQASDATLSKLLTDDMKMQLLTDLVPTTIGRTTAVNLVNPFIDRTNGSVELPVNEGYMVSSAVGQKPFVIVEYGGLKQFTEQDPEDEIVKVMLKQEASVELIFGEAIGFLKEESAIAGF